jgi:hypothetical protein
VPGLADASTRRFAASRGLRWCLPFLVAAVVVFSFFMFDVRRAEPALTGDEPSYLVFAYALTHGTFDVRAAYRDPADPVKWPAEWTPDQVVVHAGRMRSMRMPLLPLLLTPAMALGSLTLARLTMVLIAVALLDQLWRLLGDLGYRGLARAGPWLAAVTALPMLGYATHVYPEMPGALCIVVILRLLVRATRRSLVAASVVAGLLPWLIIRFAVLAVALLLVAVLIAVRPTSWHLRDVGPTLREHSRDVAIVAAPFFVSMIVFFIYVRVLYGSFDPRAVYPPGFTQAWTPWHAYVVGVGSLFGASEGFIPYGPALLIGLFGVIVAARRYRAAGWLLLGGVAIHLFVVVPTGFWGLALPGRFMIVLVPFLVIAMAEALRAAPVLKVAVIALVAVQVVIVAMYHDINVLILDRIPHYTYLALFPTVDGEPGLDGFVLPLTQAPGPVAHADGGSLRADRTLGAGVVYTSSDLALRPGRYQATLRISAAQPPTSKTQLARLTITELPRQHVLADRSINADQLGKPINLKFDAPTQPVRWTNRVVIEVDTTGAADLELRSLIGLPTKTPRSRDGVIHDDVPLAIAWLSAVAVGAGLLLIRHRRGRASTHPGT